MPWFIRAGTFNLGMVLAVSSVLIFSILEVDRRRPVWERMSQLETHFLTFSGLLGLFGIVLVLIAGWHWERRHGPWSGE